MSSVISDYLRRQIEAGADAVQLFDSWGGALAEPAWRRFSGAYTAKVMRNLADTGVPIIHYVNGGSHLIEATAELPCDVLSVDWRESLGAVAKRTGGRYALQGNIDPGILRASPSVIREGVRATYESYGDRPGLIFNLGHGITPDATVDTAKALVEAAQEFGPEFAGGS